MQQDIKAPALNFQSPALILFGIVLTVFAFEALVMLLLPLLSGTEVGLSEAIADATFLVILMAPLLYFLVFRPMASHIREREKIKQILLHDDEVQFKVMVCTSLDGFGMTNAQGQFLVVNDAYCRMTDYTREELLKMNVADVAETPNETLYRQIKRSGHFETYLRRKNGRILATEVSANYNSSAGLFSFFVRDITERKLDEEKLRRSEARLQATIDNSPYMIWQKDVDGRYIAFNTAFFKATGKESPQDVLDRTDFDIWSPRLAEKYRADDDKVMSSRKQEVLEEQAVTEGRIYWVETCKTPIIDSNGKLFGTTGFAQDISERKRTEQMLQESEFRMKELFENLNSCVAVYRSTDGQNFIITAFNRAAERLEKIRHEDVLGKNAVEVFPGIRKLGLLEVFKRVWGNGVAEHFPVSFYEDGRVSGWRENYVYKLPNGEIVAIHDDRTKEKQAEELMNHLAHYDTLTDLPNRALFNDRLQQSLVTARRKKSNLALMFLDLDQFKHVNDTLGHDIGDLLLKEAAKRILNCVREADTASRIGGDEFIILLQDVEMERDVMRVAEKILNVFNQPFELAGRSITVSSSIGIAIYPMHGSDEEAIVKNADIAMYHAKREGRNNAKLYNSEMAEEQAEMLRLPDSQIFAAKIISSHR